MKKVYCKNCKYDDLWTLECKFFKEGRSRYSGNIVDKITVQDQYKHNNDNGYCVYYERKWWKFWVKVKIEEIK